MKLRNNDPCASQLHRRGVTHGRVSMDEASHRANSYFPPHDVIRERWQAALPVHLPGLLLSGVEQHADAIRDALTIMQRVRAGESCADILIEAPFAARLEPDFDLLAPIHSGDAQEIEKIAFDAVKSGDLFAEDLWMKVSRLSFVDEDDSIRFRFSYGMEMFKNQEDDPLREGLAAELAARVFPECSIVSDNPSLIEILQSTLGFTPAFVERIIYSNAPSGGAQFHQDVEHDHCGIVYAQLYGITAWLALPRAVLVKHVQDYLRNDDSEMFSELRETAQNEAALIALFESDDQGALEILLNATPAFTHRLIEAGHGLTLAPGDVLLLPQATTEHCCWHSVFCLDDSPGHSLSFALTEIA